MSKLGTLKTIKIADVRENPDALRGVNRTSEKYLGLVESVRNVGILHPINVREIPDREDPSRMVYGLIDGLHRFNAASDAGLEEIPVYALNMNDGEVLEAQLMTNVHNIETKYSEYSDQLLRILAMNPTLTLNMLAKKLSKSPKWLGDRLSIMKLHETIRKSVDDGKINLVNAYSLAKLKDPNEQMNFLDRALSESPDVFGPIINNRIKEIRTAKSQGKDAAPEGFVPVAHLRKTRELEDEIAGSKIAQFFKSAGHVTNLDDFVMGVRWAAHMDPDSVGQAKAKWEEKKAEREKAREKAKAEKDAKKKADAEKILAEMSEAVAT
jgi:ParB/RepB/Spo0J family partition protein